MYRLKSPTLAALAVVVAALLAVGVSACGSNSASSSSSTATGGSTAEESESASTGETAEGETLSPLGEPESDEKVKGPGGGASGKNIYYVGVGDVNPWTKAFNHGVIEPLEEAGATVTYLQDPFNPQVEVENLNRAVAAKPDLIVLIGLEYPSLIPGLTRAQAEDIPVFNMTSPATPGNDLVTAQVLSNDAELGEIAAENIIEGLKLQGKTTGNVVAITGTTGLSKTQAREKGFEKVLKEDGPGLKLVAVKDGNWDEATSQKLAQQLLAQYQSQGGIQAFYGMADNQALGIIQAVKEAGETPGGKDGVVISGSNCYRGGIEAILAGEMFGTASESPYVGAETAADLILEWFEGKEIPKITYTKEEQITEKNAQKYLDENLCP